MELISGDSCEQLYQCKRRKAGGLLPPLEFPTLVQSPGLPSVYRLEECYGQSAFGARHR